jgi:hypothetical protein
LRLEVWVNDLSRAKVRLRGGSTKESRKIRHFALVDDNGRVIRGKFIGETEDYKGLLGIYLLQIVEELRTDNIGGSDSLHGRLIQTWITAEKKYGGGLFRREAMIDLDGRPVHEVLEKLCPLYFA